MYPGRAPVERFAYPPLLHLPPIAPLIASPGLFIALEEAFRLVAEPHTLAYRPTGRSGIGAAWPTGAASARTPGQPLTGPSRRCIL